MSDQSVVKSAHCCNSNAHRLLFCVDCLRVACFSCFNCNSPHSGHRFTELHEGKTILIEQYKRLWETMKNLKQSIEAANQKRDATKVRHSAEQSMRVVNELIDQVVSLMDSFRLKVVVAVNSAASRKIAELRKAITQKLIDQSRLRFEADRLCEKIDDTMLGSINELHAQLSSTTEQCKQFEQAQCNQLMEFEDGFAIDKLMVLELERLVDYCGVVVVRINGLFKQMDVNHSAAIKCDGSRETMFIVGFNEPSDQTLAYDSANNKWCYAPNVSSVGLNAAMSRWRNTLIVTGGFYMKNTVQQYDPKTNSWSPFANLLTGRHRHASVTLNDSLFVIGGVASLGMTKTVERFDSLLENWVDEPPLHRARYGHAVAATSHSIVTIGGYMSDRQCEMFDVKSQQWKPVADLNKGRFCAAAASVAGIVYVLGGRNDLHGVLFDVEQFDEMANKWTVIDERMLHERDCFAAVVADGRIYLVGGRAEVEAFDIATRQFARVATLPNSNQYGLSAASVALSPEALNHLRS